MHPHVAASFYARYWIANATELDLEFDQAGSTDIAQLAGQRVPVLHTTTETSQKGFFRYARTSVYACLSDGSRAHQRGVATLCVCTRHRSKWGESQITPPFASFKLPSELSWSWESNWKVPDFEWQHE